MMALASKPKDAHPPEQSPGDAAVEMLLTSSASGTWESSPTGRPRMSSRESGAGSAAGPMMPT